MYLQKSKKINTKIKKKKHFNKVIGKFFFLI